MSDAATTLRARGRQPDARLIPQLKNARAANLVLSDGARHAGEGPNPRPLPRTTLSDHRDHLAANAPTGSGAVPEAAHFALYVDRPRVAPDGAVAVPAEHIWWLAGWEDTVLLSDRVTHHYTTIAEVDRAGERIHFLDPWPDNFILLPGLNTLGIAARRESKLGLSVSKAEFLRAVVGLVVWDTSQLITDYLSAFPEQRQNPEIHLRFGFALMAAADDAVAAEAAALFAAALRLANTDSDMAALAAQQTYCAATCGWFQAQSSRNDEMRQAMQGYLHMVLSRYEVGALEQGLDASALCRLGLAAGRIGELGMALRVLGLGIGKDPDHESLWAARAVARSLGGDAAGAAADAVRALALNDAALERLRAERAGMRGRWELMRKDGQIAGRLEKRARELATVAKASLDLGLVDRARTAAQELVRLAPDRPENHARLGIIEQRAGRRDAAATALREAVARERNPSERATYEALLRRASSGSDAPS
jgi:tetratricopeptide (TPR) repeat protein